MDTGHFVHNQAQIYQQNQHTQQQQPQHLGPSQIPDESYIEKLFPKCQPKPSIHMRGNRKMARFNERQQQQQKRLSRNRNQPPPHSRREGPREQTSNERLASGSNNVDSSRDHNNNNASAKYQKRHDYSDSSDNETQTNDKLGILTNGGVRKSGSNQFGSDATNRVDNGPVRPNDQDSSAPKLSSAYSKPRTKKYQASKSLQQQLSRSQSSHSRLSSNSSQPSHSSKSETNAEQRQLVSGGPKDRVGELPSSSADDVNGLKPGRGNRTRRGIVFAEPLPGRAGQFDIGSLVDKEGEEKYPATAECDVIEDPYIPVNSLLLSQSRRQIPPSEQLPQTQPKQTRPAGRETADLEPIQVRSDQDAGQANEVAKAKVESSHTISVENNQESIVELIGPKSIEPNANIDPEQGDEDKFINLFVYDQTVVTSQKLDNRHLDSQSIFLSDEQKIDDLKTSTDNNKPDERHRLLATEFEDADGQDVITNDASTEELCNFDDSDTDIGLKQRLTKAKRTLQDAINLSGNLHQEKHNQDNGTNKSNLKHHRSIGTLQTVDEKAEINIEDDNPETDNNIFKTELIDISETSTMLPTKDESNVVRRAFAPPGFPQRVRPTLKTPPIPENEPQPEVPCPESSSIDSPIRLTNSTDEIVKNYSPIKKVWPSREDKAPPSETIGNSPGCRANEFIIASESQSVVEKNLSEALSKVTLDQMTADNFKDTPQSTTLRHHKLPNESSHFSAVRSPIFKAKESDVPSSHRSSVQFNTLSDNESGHDEIVDSKPRVGKLSGPFSSPRGQLKRQDTPATTSLSSGLRPSISARVHDDLPSTAKTALVFPRLDEGLSSEAESNDDEAEEEDDRAMEADVDADDDDDDDEDDEDVDEDAESPARIMGNRQTSLQTSVDSFFCHQQLLKPQNRSIGTLQQVASSQQSQDSDLQPVKPSPSSSYTNFNLTDDQTTRIDSTKPIHTGQNGVQSNYWMSGMTNQQATMSSQPSPSSASQFSIQKNQFGNSNNNNSNTTNSNMNLSRSNSYGNRDDAKAATRVSSDTDNETDRLLGTQRNDQLQKLTVNEVASSTQAVDSQATNSFSGKQGSNSREVQIEGVLFNVKYLGSTHTECEGRGEKEDRIQQAEMAVHEVKFRNGELQTAVEAQLFISTEKIMVLDDKKRVIMMDHSLRTISYIADIGDAVVLIVRKKSSSLDTACDTGRPMSKTSCHVFESNESHTITKSISQAFHVAYTELLKANGGGDPNSYLPKELDYQEVLNSQEMPMTELDMFASKNNQREVIVPKQVGEILGLSIVESGWGSVLPTAVIASLKQDGPAYRCKKLSVGDQILSINGESLVGLSLAECQQKLRKTKAQSVARLWVVPCPITVEVKIKRPDTKYQLGFSVQHGVICSLLRGGIAERGGVRVGHRIISINGTTVVGVPHDKIVTLLASSVGEIRMKTCLTSLYRHMLGEEKKHQWV